MKAYVIDMEICDDEGKAIERAKELVDDYSRDEGDIEWEQDLSAEQIRDGWVFYAPYSPEGDSIRVMRRDVQCSFSI